MRVLFLPNFRVERLDKDDPSIPTPNKVVGSDGYWFFKHIPDMKVDVLDNRAPFPFGVVSKKSKVELFQALRALLVHGEYDLVISHSYNSGFVFSFLRSLLGISQPMHIVVDVGSLNGGKEEPFQIFLIKFALESVSGLVCHSRINQEFYAKHFPSTANAFVYFGTDPEFFSSPRNAANGDYALSVGITSRDTKTLLRAWERIDFPLKIVGSTRRRRTLSRGIEALPQVSIVELMEIIGNAGVVVLPLMNNRYSVGQMTLTQSMALRKPIVVADVHGVRDYVMSGENCITYRCGDSEDLAEKVNLVLNDKELAERISRNARRDIVQRFNERAMAEGIMQFVERIGNGKHF